MDSMKPKAATYYKQNRLKQLRAFCFTARTGSISKAASQLYLSQPSVSLQIQALERELNTILFERRGPRISLTPDGEALLGIAIPLVEGMDSLRDSFAERAGNLNSGYINIAAGESSILYLLPNYIKQFQQQYPGVRIKLHNTSSLDALAMVRSDEADFALGPMLQVPDDLFYRNCYTFEQTLICAKNHPLSQLEEITLADIAQYDLILPPRYLNTWGIINSTFQEQNLNCKVKIEVGGWEVIKRYVAADLGISIVTSLCLQTTDDLFQAPMTRYFPHKRYGIITRRGRFIPAQARRMIEEIAADYFTHKGAPSSIDQSALALEDIVTSVGDLK